MTAVLGENYRQLPEQSSYRRLPPTYRPRSLLPSRCRHELVNAKLRSHSAGVTVEQPCVYCEVFARPVVLSHRQHRVATSKSMYEVNKRFPETSVLQSVSDSNVLAKSHTLRTDRLKPGLITTDVKVQRSVCPSSAVSKVSSKTSDDAVPSSVISQQGDCRHRSEDIAATNHRQSRSAIINQYIKKNLESSDARSHLASGQNNKRHRWLQVRTNKRQTNAEPFDSGFLAHAVRTDDDEFLEKLRKSCSRPTKARRRSRSNTCRQRERWSTWVVIRQRSSALLDSHVLHVFLLLIVTHPTETLPVVSLADTESRVAVLCCKHQLKCIVCKLSSMHRDAVSSRQMLFL